MSIANYVTSSVKVGTRGLKRADFKTPLIISHSIDSSTWNDGEIREYGSVDDLADDFSADSPEMRAAAALLSHPDVISKFLVARSSAAPTQRYSVALVAQNSKTYKFKVSGQGFNDTEVSLESDASATTSELAASLVAALNAVVGKNFTASGVSSPIAVTANTPGAWFSLEQTAGPECTLAQDHASSGLAATMTTIKGNRNDWACVYSMYNSNAYVLALAAWCQSNGKIYFCELSETASTVGTGTALDLFTAGYENTTAIWHVSPYRMIGASLAGAFLTGKPGTNNGAHLKLPGIPVSDLSDTKKAALRSVNCNFYEEVVEGLRGTTPGKTVSGEWMDLVFVKMAIRDSVDKAFLEAIFTDPKLPYRTSGAAVVGSAITGALQQFALDGAILPDFSVAVPEASSQSPENRTARNYAGITWSAIVTGAVNSGEVSGTLGE
jgi:hypothetical protein